MKKVPDFQATTTGEWLLLFMTAMAVDFSSSWPLRQMAKEVCEALKGVNHENVKKRYVYNLTVTGSYRMIIDS